MQKIGDVTTTANAAGEFIEGNPGAGVGPTLLKAGWFNTIQRELIALVEGGGLTLSSSDDGQVFKAIKAMFNQGLGLITPARFDNTKKGATTEFVQRALGNFSFSQQLSGARVLDAGYCGQNIWLSGSSNYSVSLPSVANLATGSVLYFWSSNPGTVTLNRVGTDNIFLKSSSVSSITLGEGDSLYLVSNPDIGWIAFGGSKQIGLSATFASSSGANGYQRLPGGLIECRGSFTSSATAGAAVPVSFPFGLASLHSLVITPNSASAAAVSAWYDSATGSGFNGHCNLANTVCTYIAKGV